MIMRENFIIVMDAIEKQHAIDIDYAEKASALHGGSDLKTYDNSLLLNSLFKLLQADFVPVNGECIIEDYCYNHNFGIVDGERVLDFDRLYTILVVYLKYGCLQIENDWFIKETEKYKTLVDRAKEALKNVSSPFGLDWYHTNSNQVEERFNNIAASFSPLVDDKTPYNSEYLIDTFKTNLVNEINLLCDNLNFARG
jgi:hypothetical protein